MSYRMIEEPMRVVAVAHDDRAICGAYQTEGHEYWSLYATTLISDLTGLVVPPHREHFYGENGRMVATAWVEMIAALYVRAAQVVTA